MKKLLITLLGFMILLTPLIAQEKLRLKNSALVNVERDARLHIMAVFIKEFVECYGLENNISMIRRHYDEDCIINGGDTTFEGLSKEISDLNAKWPFRKQSIVSDIEFELINSAEGRAKDTNVPYLGQTWKVKYTTSFHVFNGSEGIKGLSEYEIIIMNIDDLYKEAYRSTASDTIKFIKIIKFDETIKSRQRYIK